MTAALIERLERAEGGDRELDADLDVFLFGGETVWKQANYTMEMYPASRRASTNHVGGWAFEHVPLYTASIDAAAALVERMLPGWEYGVGRNSRNGDAWVGSVPPEGQSGFLYGARAATPAIALLIALLRSMESRDA